MTKPNLRKIVQSGKKFTASGDRLCTYKVGPEINLARNPAKGYVTSPKKGTGIFEIKGCAFSKTAPRCDAASDYIGFWGGTWYIDTRL